MRDFDRQRKYNKIDNFLQLDDGGENKIELENSGQLWAMQIYGRIGGKEFGCGGGEGLGVESLRGKTPVRNQCSILCSNSE